MLPKSSGAKPSVYSFLNATPTLLKLSLFWVLGVNKGIVNLHQESLYIIFIIDKPKYRWRNEENFEEGYLEAQVGDSPTVHFTVDSKPPLAEDAEHTLTKDGKAVTKRFIVKGNSVRFKKVRLEDNGVYTLSCRNDRGLVGEDTIELEISSVAIPSATTTPTTTTPTIAQPSQGELIHLLTIPLLGYNTCTIVRMNKHTIILDKRNTIIIGQA